MRSHGILTGLAALLLAATADAANNYNNNNSNNNNGNIPDAAPKRYLVELKDLGCGDRVKARVARTAGLRLAKAFDHALFPALSIECDDCDADSLSRLLDAPEPGARIGDDDAAPVVAAVYKPAMMQLRLPEEGPSYADDAAALNYTFHGLTGVQELHDQGIIGDGATVAIVDSGVDWTHEAFGNGFGPGHTIAGGYDLVGDGSWPQTPPAPDDKPNDQFGHGTHVAGIVAGRSKQFVGVAPGAKILAFKVIGHNGQSNEEMVIEAFLRAFDSGADIITASVGEKSGFTTNAWATLASRMVDQGVFITIAGGNDGEDGAFLMSNGAAGKHVMTVAASATDMVPAYPFTAEFALGASINKSELAYAPAPGRSGPDFFPRDIAGWPIVPLTVDPAVPADACDPITRPPAGLNNQTVLLVREGGCEMWQKQRNLGPLQAPYTLFYQDGESAYTAPSANSGGTLTAIIDAKAGEAIVKTIAAGGNVTASFDQSTTRWVGMRDAKGGRPADFTQWGPNYDMELKPDIAAPGVRVLSSYLGGGYKVLSGTSMATPYVAGVAALWVGKHGGRKTNPQDPAWAKRLAARIMSTARSAPWVDGLNFAVSAEFLAPPVQMGAGNVHAGRVFEATTEFGFEGRKFALNDTAHFRAEHSVEITNSVAAGAEPVTYEFSIEPAAGFDSWTPNFPGAEPRFGKDVFKAYYEITPLKIVPQIQLPHPLTLSPGESATAKFTFSLPTTNLNATTIPLYGGKIKVKASNGQTFGLPYYGAGSDIKSVIPGNFARAFAMPNMVSGAGQGGTPIAQKSNFTFDLDRYVQDFPTLIVRTMYGARELRWDVYDADSTTDDGWEANWEYPPVPGRKGYVGSATSWSKAGDTSYFDPATQDENDVFAFPRYNIPRDVYKQYMWLGRLANTGSNGTDGTGSSSSSSSDSIKEKEGRKIQPGRYRLRIAALRPMGDPRVAGDWDVWRTPVVTVLPMNKGNGTDIGEKSSGRRGLRMRGSIGARL